MQDDTDVIPTITYEDEIINGVTVKKAVITHTSDFTNAPGEHLYQLRVTTRMTDSEYPEFYGLMNKWGECGLKILYPPKAVTAGFIPDPVTGLMDGDDLSILKDGDEDDCGTQPPDVEIDIIPRGGGGVKTVVPMALMMPTSYTMKMTLPEPAYALVQIRIRCHDEDGFFTPEIEIWDPPPPPPPPPPRPPDPPPPPPFVDPFDTNQDPNDDQNHAQDCGQGWIIPENLQDARDWGNWIYDPQKGWSIVQSNTWDERVHIGNRNKIWFIVNSYITADPIGWEDIPPGDPRRTQDWYQYMWASPEEENMAWKEDEDIRTESAWLYSDYKNVDYYQDSQGRLVEEHINHFRTPGYSQVRAVKRKLYCKRWSTSSQRWVYESHGGYILFLSKPGDAPPVEDGLSAGYKHRIELKALPEELAIFPQMIDNCSTSEDRHGATVQCDQFVFHGESENRTPNRHAYPAEGNASRPGDKHTWEDGIVDGALSPRPTGNDPNEGLLTNGSPDRVWVDIVTGIEICNGLPDINRNANGWKPSYCHGNPNEIEEATARSDLFLLVRFQDAMRVRNLSLSTLYFKAASRETITANLVQTLDWYNNDYDDSFNPNGPICYAGKAIYAGYKDAPDPLPDDGFPDREEHYYLIPLSHAFYCIADSNPDDVYSYYILLRDTRRRWRYIATRVGVYLNITQPTQWRKQYLNLTRSEESFKPWDWSPPRPYPNCTTVDASKGRAVCIEAEERYNGGFAAGHTAIPKPGTQRFKDWSAKNQWTLWEWAPIFFYYQDILNQVDKKDTPPSDDPNSPYYIVPPTNLDIQEVSCDSPPCYPLQPDNHHFNTDPNPDNPYADKNTHLWGVSYVSPWRYYNCQDQRGVRSGYLPCTRMMDYDLDSVSSNWKARAYLFVNSYGGDNALVEACRYPAKIDGGCVGPKHEPPDRDIVSWRKIKVEVNPMPGKVGVELNKDDEHNLYVTASEYPPPIPPDFEEDVYPYLSPLSPYPYHTNTAGAYDDAFIEMEFVDAGNSLHWIEGVGGDSNYPIDSTQCGNPPQDNLPKNVPPYIYARGLFPDWTTSYHANNPPPPDSETPAQLLGVNFLGSHGDENAEFPMGSKCWLPTVPVMDIDSTTGYCVLVHFTSGFATNRDTIEHAHSFVGIGVFRFANQYIHLRDKDPRPEYFDPECPNWTQVPYYDVEAIGSRHSTHELGHIIGGFDHTGGYSVDCRENNQNLPSVMSFPYLNPTSNEGIEYFCIPEIKKLRESPRFPSE